jgi:hypothetical protein
MNHEAISTALCGHYTRLSEVSGYLESIYATRGDGALLGAYIIERGLGGLIVTDDGDTLFNAAAIGAEINWNRARAYRKAAESNGVILSEKGELRVETSIEQLTPALSSYFRAALAVSDLAYKHRPSDAERFIRTIGEDLARFGGRVTPRPVITGLSGHQLRFHFGLDIAQDDAVMIQAVAASNGSLKWGDVYETGGKFKDAKAARSHLRLVAVLEDAEDVDKASSFLSDMADVLVYRGAPLPLAA